MKEILVTGGFGFMGSHLLEALGDEHSIHVVDDLSTSPLALPNLLDELGAMPGLTYDICSVQEYCKRKPPAHFDEIYHLASIVGPAGVIPHMGRIVKAIVDDTYAMIELAERCDAKLVDVSTSEVYGGGQGGFCSEGMAKVIPAITSARVEYAVAKLASETALINATQATGLRACIVRPFNISGPRQSGKGGFVLPRFVSSALKHEDVTIFGDGTQIRAFTHVKDIVSGVVLAMEKGACGEAYNLGNPQNRCSIGELADETITMAESRSRKVYVDPRTIYGPFYAEANDKFPDAEKAMSDLGWAPVHDRAAVIQDTVEYFRRLSPTLLKTLSGDPAFDAAEKTAPAHRSGPHEVSP